MTEAERLRAIIRAGLGTSAMVTRLYVLERGEPVEYIEATYEKDETTCKERLVSQVARVATEVSNRG